MRTGNEMDLDPLPRQFAPAIKWIEGTEERLAPRSQQRHPACIRLRHVLAARAQMDLPELQLVLGKLRSVDEFFHIDDRSAARAGTLSQTAPENRQFSLDQFAPLFGFQT